MKKTIKRVLLGVAAIFVIFAGIGLYNIYPLLSMKPVKTGPIPNSNIFAIKNSLITVYFVKTDSGYIMIDAAADLKKFEALMKKEGININDVKWIFLTHSDYDHVAALPLFPNAQILMSEDELQLVNGTTVRMKSSGNTMPPGIDINKINLLSNNQEFSFSGTKVKCIKAPGHTTGSMFYLIDNKYLFTGDAFGVAKGALIIHPFTMDAELARKTMETLKETINSSVVLSAHYGSHERLVVKP